MEKNPGIRNGYDSFDRTASVPYPHTLPSAYPDHVTKEFNQLIIDASLLSQDEQSDLHRTTDFLENAQLSEQTYEMLMTMIFFACLLPATYFFISELFFRGRPWEKPPFVYESHRLGATCPFPPSASLSGQY